MKNFNLACLSLSAAALISPSCLAAENIRYLCQNDDQQRVIEVIYSSENAVPCEVHYQRSGLDDVLWQADNEIGYCEQKAENFVAKQQAWGWQCEQQVSAPRPQAPTNVGMNE